VIVSFGASQLGTLTRSLYRRPSLRMGWLIMALRVKAMLFVGLGIEQPCSRQRPRAQQPPSPPTTASRRAERAREASVKHGVDACARRSRPAGLAMNADGWFWRSPARGRTCSRILAPGLFPVLPAGHFCVSDAWLAGSRFLNRSSRRRVSRVMQISRVILVSTLFLGLMLLLAACGGGGHGGY
jgi:hypothetical protein